MGNCARIQCHDTTKSRCWNHIHHPNTTILCHNGTTSAVVGLLCGMTLLVVAHIFAFASLRSSSGNARLTYVEKSTGRSWSKKSLRVEMTTRWGSRKANIFQPENFFVHEDFTPLYRPNVGNLRIGDNQLPASFFDTRSMSSLLKKNCMLSFLPFL